MVEGEKTVVKGLSLLGGGIDGNCVQIEVENGRIIGIPTLTISDSWGAFWLT
jgi:hypothetical protein